MTSPHAASTASGVHARIRDFGHKVPGALHAARFWLPCAAMALAAAFVIADTWDVFSATWDEPAHIAGGIELLDNATYDYEPLHPPVGRVAAALGPRLAGIEHAGRRDIWQEGQHILYEQGDYWRTLTLARAGTLPFFILGALMTGLMARRFFGMAAGFSAVALFVTTPILLGLGGLAITDMAMTAFWLAAVLAFLRWLETGRHRDALLLGIATGLAVMSKYSAVPFLAVTFLAILLLRWRFGGERPFAFRKVPRLRWGFDLSLIAAVMTLWAVHGFLFAPVDITGRVAHKFTGEEPAQTQTEAPSWDDRNGIPLPMFFKSVADGLGSVLARNAGGKESYFLGRWRQQAHPLFFPVTLGVKLPLPLLILGLAGLGLTVWQGLSRRQWTALVPASAFALILGIGMLSNLNYGLRHVLPLVPLLCVMAAGGAVIAFSRLAAYGRLAQAGAAALMGALFVWQAAGTARAHPDHLAWFNEIAGDRPEDLLVIGDLDWGQDLQRLSRELERLEVERLHLLYVGSARPARHGLPPFEPLNPYDPPVTGWVATHLRASLMFPEKLRWLSERESVARAGKTFDIYYLPPEQERGGR